MVVDCGEHMAPQLRVREGQDFVENCEVFQVQIESVAHHVPLRKLFDVQQSLSMMESSLKLAHVELKLEFLRGVRLGFANSNSCSDIMEALCAMGHSLHRCVTEPNVSKFARD